MRMLKAPANLHWLLHHDAMWVVVIHNENNAQKSCQKHGSGDVCAFSLIGVLWVGYSWGIRGVFMGYSWDIRTYRVCVGYVSGKCRRGWGAKQGMLLTTDEHGFARKHEIYILGSVKVSGVQWLKYNRGKMFLGGRYTNHGRARMDTETRRYN